MFIYVHAYIHVKIPGYPAEISSLDSVGSVNWTHIVKLGSKYLNLRINLTGPYIVFVTKFKTYWNYKERLWGLEKC